jgi:alkanesulfonate monooxygenase SsuD/methylene tetrahydromethanopterin reductase-like flavin-dependent oxidoreductase (luciferase family)
MPDYGRDIQFGYFLTPDASDAAGALRAGELLDRLGFDLVVIQDHPYQRSFLDGWTLLIRDSRSHPKSFGVS